MPDYSHWLSKKQAADALGCSEKTVERLAGRNKITSRLWKRPAGAAITVFHPADVERIRSRRNPPTILQRNDADSGAAPVLPVLQNPLDRAIKLSTDRKQVPETTALAVSNLSKTRRVLNPFAIVPIDRKLFLTRREAAEFAGLPVSAIKAAIAAGVMPAIRTGRGIRIVREMINALELASFLAERSSDLLARSIGVAVPPSEPDLNTSTEQ